MIIYMDFFWYILKRYSQLLIPILLGSAAFILVTGGKILWPSNIDWLSDGDQIEALCAWEFFRYTPVFQNPLGANYPYGMGLGGSVIYGEPLLIFAFPFKLFSNLLPTPFQYGGIWILLCFILQAIFSWKLLEKITANQWLKSLGSIFFVLSPAFLARCTAGAFFGQWLILAGMWFYLSTRFRSFAWCLLLCISSLVHAYLLFMLLMLWAADLLKRIILIELTYQVIIKFILLTALILLVVMWQAGYFMQHGGYVAPGLGLYRMNLISFIDPFIKEGSRILVPHSHTAGDYEGYSYLGFGIIILGIFGLAGFLNLKKKQQIKIIVSNVKKIAPILGVSFLLMIFALSNRIVFGQHELFQYELPEIFGIFRATGRMALPIYYLIYLGIFYLIVKCYRYPTSIILILICLAIQITDLSKAINKFKHFCNKLHTYNCPLKSSIWLQAANKYKKIFYTLPELDPDKWDWRALARYAAFNKLSINAGYFARQNVELFNKKKVALINKLIHGELDKDAFYIVKDKNMLRFIVNAKMNLSYKICKTDGYFLVLPNWTENLNKTEQYELENYQGYILDTHIFLRKIDENSKNNVILVKGWSAPEENGTWTDGNSLMVLQLDKKTDSDLILTIEGSPYINVEHPTLEVDIVVNHKNIEHVTYNIGDSPSNKQVIIPKSILNDNNALSIEFKFKNAVSPKQLKLSSDNRKLGLFILSLNLTKKISQ